MSSVLDHLVLDLNRVNQAIGIRSVRDAITAMAGDNGACGPAGSFDIVYAVRPDGSFDMDSIVDARPVTWDEWIQLPVRACDEGITTARGAIRAPTVIQAPEYAEVPMVTPKLTARGVFERDQFICQYSGVRLPPDELNLDHVVPLDMGGRTTWTNVVCSSIRINTMKRNRLPHQAGLRLIRRPRAPKSIPRSFLIRAVRHPSWLLFLPHLVSSDRAA